MKFTQLKQEYISIYNHINEIIKIMHDTKKTYGKTETDKIKTLLCNILNNIS